ncbi:MAG: sensor histidine kinase, partial [Planctomycetota bacterium]
TREQGTDAGQPGEPAALEWQEAEGLIGVLQHVKVAFGQAGTDRLFVQVQEPEQDLERVHAGEAGWTLLVERDIAQALAPIRRLQWIILLISLAVTAAALLIGLATASGVNRSLARLRTAVQQIGAGNLDVRVDIPPDDEIGALGATLNKMAVDLKQTTASRDLLETEVAERKRAEQRLEVLNTELERSNRDLEEFTYTVSHDLQEPLRKIHTFGQFLVEDCGDHIPDEGREHLRRMQDGAVRMKELIQHLLSLARVGTRGGEMAAVEPQAVLETVLEDLGPRIEETGAEVSVEGQLPTVMADEVQLGQVFQNLIGNALKFRAEGRAPRIAVGAALRDGWATFSVSDNGIGIEEQFLEKVFGVFRRLHPPESYEGSGIGLALCEKIIRRHGGSIWAESEVASGSTFRFALPLATNGDEEEQRNANRSAREDVVRAPD